MPRRTNKKCKARASSTLDLVSEMNMVHWQALIPGTEFSSTKQLQQMWEDHGEQVLANHIKCLPGTRPAAMYQLGIVPLPTVVNHARPGDMVQVWDRLQVYPAWCHFGSFSGDDNYFQGGRYWGEFQHLNQLGLLSKDEHTRAVEWVDDRHYVPGWEPRRYEPIVREFPALFGVDSEDTISSNP